MDGTISLPIWGMLLVSPIAMAKCEKGLSRIPFHELKQTLE